MRIRGLVAALVVLAMLVLPAGGAQARSSGLPGIGHVRHVVVIFQENVSFDHYFGTYPLAANPPGQPAFHAAPGGVAAHLLERDPARPTARCAISSGRAERR